MQTANQFQLRGYSYREDEAKDRYTVQDQVGDSQQSCNRVDHHKPVEGEEVTVCSILWEIFLHLLLRYQPIDWKFYVLAACRLS